MTAIGGLGHTLPYLIPRFLDRDRGRRSSWWWSSSRAISYIRYRYMDTPFLPPTFQIVVGGVLVFLAGILIGSS